VNHVATGFKVELHAVSCPSQAETLILDHFGSGQKEGGRGQGVGVDVPLETGEAAMQFGKQRIGAPIVRHGQRRPGELPRHSQQVVGAVGAGQHLRT